MAYVDLLSDAILTFSYDNTDMYSLNVVNGSEVITSTGTGTPVYVADVPAGIGATYSMKANGYANLPRRWKFKGLSNGIPDPNDNNAGGKTFTCWFKLVPTVPLVSGTTPLGSTMIFYTTQNNSGSSQQDYMRIGFGTYNSAINGGSDRFIQIGTAEVSVSTSTLTNTSHFALEKLQFNKWHHLAVTTRELDAQNLVERVIYIDGVVVNYSNASNKALQNVNFGTYPGISAGFETLLCSGTTNESNLDKYVSYAAYWQRPLTHEEIRAQAWFNHQNEDYQSLVLGDNPTYYATLDNSDKATNHTVLAGSTWGSLDDTPAGFYVNETGPANTKAWRIISTAQTPSNYAPNYDPDMLSGLSTLMKSGEFTIEFWSKMSDKPASDRTMLQIGLNTADYPNGYLQFRYDSLARAQIVMGYKSGATTYVTGSMLGSSISAVDTATVGAEFYRLHPGNYKNFGDNQWHHIVYTHSNTDAGNGTAGSSYGILYVDGCLTSVRAWTNTYGWLDGTGNTSTFYLGNQNANTLHRDNSLAELAFYPRRLSQQEVHEHFIAGKDYVSEQGAVKYYDGSTWQLATAAKTWNGTAWVDWVKKYWNGTAWVDLP